MNERKALPYYYRDNELSDIENGKTGQQTNIFWQPFCKAIKLQRFK